MSYYKLSSPPTEGIQVIYESCSQRCCFKQYNMTGPELESLNILRMNARRPFDKENEGHKELLKRFWAKVFGDAEYPLNGVSEKWKELGFQGKDPSTDFRGAGLFGLQQLMYLAETYPNEFIEMKNSAKNYSFAISALNITVLLT